MFLLAAQFQMRRAGPLMVRHMPIDIFANDRSCPLGQCLVSELSDGTDFAAAFQGGISVKSAHFVRSPCGSLFSDFVSRSLAIRGYQQGRLGQT
jgi:hypothetical protein